MIVVVVEHDRGTMAPASLEAMTSARSLAATMGAPLHALTIGADADPLATELGAFGAETVHQIGHELLTDYGPELWGEAVAQAIDALDPAVVMATGTDRGNEVLAQAAARRDVAMVANGLSYEPGPPFTITRVRWGGSLHEQTSIDTAVLVTTLAHHSVEASPADTPGAGTPVALAVDLDSALTRTRIRDRVEREAGITLATAPVVVGGGRGVGSPEGFEPLEDLADLLGGVVGCSRAVTNNGWRNHTDQVGQTGTRIAPEVYFACGISGAVQHWVGAMASKHIIAINTDPEANMVTKAGYAVIADLHEMVPAIAEEIRRRG
ncbi:MAG: electron transfer flavoprotein subunit alpha/FixB family protein [Acidimicrobiia bacterium]|nr:electron transfer flavoprotein subunit alpha/FixB family protein [Acidimicrobiia bacterium]